MEDLFKNAIDIREIPIVYNSEYSKLQEILDFEPVDIIPNIYNNKVDQNFNNYNTSEYVTLNNIYNNSTAISDNSESISKLQNDIDKLNEKLENLSIVKNNYIDQIKNYNNNYSSLNNELNVTSPVTIEDLENLEINNTQINLTENINSLKEIEKQITNLLVEKEKYTNSLKEITNNSKSNYYDTVYDTKNSILTNNKEYNYSNNYFNLSKEDKSSIENSFIIEKILGNSPTIKFSKEGIPAVIGKNQISIEDAIKEHGGMEKAILDSNTNQEKVYKIIQEFKNKSIEQNSNKHYYPTSNFEGKKLYNNSNILNLYAGQPSSESLYSTLNSLSEFNSTSSKNNLNFNSINNFSNNIKGDNMGDIFKNINSSINNLNNLKNNNFFNQESSIFNNSTDSFTTQDSKNFYTNNTNNNLDTTKIEKSFEDGLMTLSKNIDSGFKSVMGALKENKAADIMSSEAADIASPSVSTKMSKYFKDKKPDYITMMRDNKIDLEAKDEPFSKGNILSIF